MAKLAPNDGRSLGCAGGLADHSLLRNGLYNVGGQTVRGVVSLLTIPFLIRFLGLREYGVWSLAFAVFGLMTVSEAGLSVAATVFLSNDLAKDDPSEVCKTLTALLISAVVLSVSLGLFLWLAGPLMVRPMAAFGSVERADAGRALQIAGFALSLLILQRTLVGVEQAFDQYAVINSLDIFQSFLLNVGLVAVSWSGERAVALMKWHAFAWAVLLSAHCWFVSGILRGKGLSFKWAGAKARRILHHSLATWTSALGSAAFSQCDRLIVGAVLGAPLLGVYSAITGITSKINSFSGMAVQPLLSSLSRDAATNISRAVADRIRQATHLNALIAIEAGIFFYVLADWVMRLMVPEAAGWQAVVALQIAAIIYALYSLNAPGYFVLFSLGEARANAIIVLASSSVSLGLILVGARYFGLLGAIAGNAAYIGTLLMIVFALKQARVPLRRYLTWIALPLLGLAAALFLGLILAPYFWWRVAFVAIQAALFMFWFWGEQGGLAWLKPRWGPVTQD